MKFVFAGINANAGDLKDLAEEKLSKLDQYFERDVEADVTFERYKEEAIVEVTVYLPKSILRAEESADTFPTAIDRVLETLERQVRKHKTKLKNRYHDTETIKFAEFEGFDEGEKEESSEPKIVKVKSFALKPMMAEEACLQMDMLGHNFFVFLDGEDQEVKVVYKRKDGNYGMIESTLD